VILNINQCKDAICEALLFNPAILELHKIQPLTPDEFSCISDRVFPSFCYDNSYHAATSLDAEMIVYGAALIRLEDGWIPVEHAWVRFSDGRCVDPTYQKLKKVNSLLHEVKYFKLFEIPTLNYIDTAEKLGNSFSKIVAMDFMWFRKSPEFKRYFNNSHGK
jgi:hypothetical protein